MVGFALIVDPKDDAGGSISSSAFAR